MNVQPGTGEGLAAIRPWSVTGRPWDAPCVAFSREVLRFSGAGLRSSLV